MRTKLIISLLLLMLAVIFAIQNSSGIIVKFFFWETAIPVALIIVIALSVGVILGLIVSKPGKKSVKTDDKKTENKASGKS
ncbi:MAG TPA: LapA family protein [Bacteroidales bacterium]|nr:LapA family protein [Bacteroidales bacterium]